MSTSTDSNLPEDPNSVKYFALDTTSCSLLHRLECNFKCFKNLPIAYLIIVSITFIPLLIAYLTSSNFSSNANKLSFFQDWNVIFMFLCSFPCVFIFTLTDEHLLLKALKSVQRDGAIDIPRSNFTPLKNIWQKKFRSINILGQTTGIIIGIAVSYFNLIAYTPESVGFWIAQDGQLLPVGYIFLYCIFLFYFSITVYLFRNFGISLLLRDIVSHSKIHMLPLHPDKAGGLKPVGKLGLRNQYVLMLLGINIVLLGTITHFYLEPLNALYGLIIAATFAYILTGPIAFMAPLVPFRKGMLKTKSELMEEVSQRLRLELQKLRKQLKSGPITKRDEKLIERLRNIGKIIDSLPVWPFDANTLRRFLSAYLVPILGSLGYPIVNFLSKFIEESFKG